jgi:hypothetical protein
MNTLYSESFTMSYMEGKDRRPVGLSSRALKLEGAIAA